MDSKVTRFFQGLQGKTVGFIGIGVSNLGSMKLFAQKGISVTAYDKKSREELGPVCDELEQAGVKLCLGEGYLDTIDDDMVFRTPGMNFFHPVLTQLRKRGKAVVSEMEIFFDLCPCKLYAVTGSDGKTTTTTVMAKMLELAGKKVYLGGNIGRALLPLIEEITPDDAAVVELSSFQLISMRKSPDVAVITNIAPNHLDVHKDMEEYISAKENIFVHQNGCAKAVFNLDNDITRALSHKARGRVAYFSRKEMPENGSFLDDEGYLCMNDYGHVTRVLKAEEIKIPGVHNVENYLTAIAALWGEVQPQDMAQIAKTFGGVEHRIELVRELDGVKYYNDSIASSPTRTIAGLNAFKQKVILIAGGYDKKIPFEPLAPKILEKVKILILMGHTADKIEQAVRAQEGFAQSRLEIVRVDNMLQAVNVARNMSHPGDIVTLSPACASFDLYKNFEARGRHFKELVNAL